MDNQVYLIAGSNRRPIENTRFALRLLREKFQVHAISSAWETPAVDSKAPNFINIAIWLSSEHDPDTLKYQYLRPIEEKLGRIRYLDKNAPRTIDIDCIIYNHEILDPSIWDKPNLVIPLAELIPEIRQPGTNLTLQEIAQAFKQDSHSYARLDLNFHSHGI